MLAWPPNGELLADGVGALVAKDVPPPGIGTVAAAGDGATDVDGAAGAPLDVPALFVELTGAGETPKAEEELLEGELTDWVGAGFNGLPGLGASGFSEGLGADSPAPAAPVVSETPADGDELAAGSSTAAAAGTAATSGRERSIR
ncbi:MAG TPA: hypothetical protein VGN42_00940 [Pirellulales bacterium]|nr:hypothetical protein [Pirellulales bacterium]